MSNHFSMGAINKETLKYEYPRMASKNNIYKCPSCDNAVIFRKGIKKQPHYAHKKSDNPCYYYDRPNESQIHKDAKMLMTTLLDNKTNITFYRKCYDCNEDPDVIYEITKDEYNDDTKSVIEYKFNYNNSNRRADVALVEKDKIKYIFEICYKNKTKEDNRPEPWVEIDAGSFINIVNTNEYNCEIEIECKREYQCASCEQKEKCETKQYYNMLTRMRMKEKEQKNEMRELCDMGKEDERTIRNISKITLEREKERLEREHVRRQQELEREQQRKKLEQEYNEKLRKEAEYMKKLLDQNNSCSTCKINYCKCDRPNFTNGACVQCKKRKCICVKITSFFKI
jgi:hypothetical protein